VSARLQSASAVEVFRSLDDGLEVEIIFQFRLYERIQGVFSFLGDRLVLESRPTYRAKKDFFEDVYILTTSGGTRRAYGEPEDFLHDFFRLGWFRLPGFVPEPRKSYTVRARISLSHARLASPLNLIYVFFPVGVTTEWKDTLLEQDGHHEAP